MTREGDDPVPRGVRGVAEGVVEGPLLCLVL